MMNLTIKVKLTMVFLVFLVTSLLLGGIGLYSLASVNAKNDSVIDTWLPGVSVSRTMNGLIGDYRVAVYKHIAFDSTELMQAEEKTMEQVDEKISEALSSYTKLIDEGEYATEAERQADYDGINGVKSDWDAYRREAQNAVTLSREGKPQEAMAVQMEKCTPLVESMKAKVEQIVEFNQKGSEAIGEEVTSTYEFSRLSLIVVFIVAFLIGSAIIFWIGREILSAIQQLLAASREIAKGNLRVSSSVKTNDELGELATASNQMVENVKHLIAQIQKSAEHVAASSEELTASADQSAEVTQSIAKSITNVSAVTTDQVSAVTAATDSMANVAAGIEQSAATLQMASEKTKSAVDTAKEGTETINGAVMQVRSIEETVNQLAVVVAKLGERSKEIGQIVDTISGIAGQTNLLALNAAIEAARAGEMGKGFAVVAEEVRKLAEQSQDAAKEIEKLITEIQVDTDQAVAAMEKGTQEVKTGAIVVQEAGTSFTKIYEMVDTVNQQANEMAKTMEELASGTQQVVNSIQEIDASSKNVAAESQSVSAATEEQSASMEEIAASSRNLANLAQELTETSSRFKI